MRNVAVSEFFDLSVASQLNVIGLSSRIEFVDTLRFKMDHQDPTPLSISSPFCHFCTSMTFHVVFFVFLSTMKIIEKSLEKITEYLRSPYFITDSNKYLVQYEHPLFLFYDKVLKDAHSILPIMEQCHNEEFQTRSAPTLATHVQATA